VHKIILILLLTCLSLSCNKWVDPKPVTDPRLTNPYCNDPTAVNYNWGFPGKPDNTVCFYPTDMFAGRFLFIDSIYSESGLNFGNFLYALTDTLSVTTLSHTKMTIAGFCSTGSIMKLTALTFTATVDTTVGDTLTTTQGQLLCRTKDTVYGTIFYSRTDSLLHINFQVMSDTGLSSHVGKARKL